LNPRPAVYPDNFLREIELAVGFEPTTCGLRNRCSTTELRQQLAEIVGTALPLSYFSNVCQKRPLNIAKKVFESKMKFVSLHLTLTCELATIAHNDVCLFFESHQISQEEGMKRSHVPLKMDAEQPKSLLKKISLLEDRSKPKNRGSKQLKMVQKVTAGHVRGGHSFH
jgi:hypothetical protein